MSGLALAPIPFDEAKKLIKDKPTLTKGVFNQLIPELKGLAFVITGIESVNVLQRARDTIAAMPQGRRWEDIKADLISEISPWIVTGETEEELEASARAAERRATLLMRLHGFGAYETAHSKVLEEMGDAFSHYRWQTMGDQLVRPSHIAMDGITLPRESPFWRAIWPRRGFNCRCQLIGITPEEAEADLEHDRKLDPEKRMYLEGSALRQLEEGGIINRGPSKQFNLSQEAASGPHRQWGTLRIDPAELRDRYDPDVWAEFERFAQATEIGKGRTVWGWLNEYAPPVPAPAPEPEPKIIPAWPETLTGIKVIKRLGGSTGAELVEDEHGQRFVMKKGASADHLREEVLADQLYAALGVPVPDVRLFEADGQPVKLAKFVEGETLATYLGKASARDREAVIAKLANHLHVDALLGNWDVTGTGNDNVIVDATGTPWRIDNGGSLRFRAQGKAKTPDEWNQFPTEVWSMRDPKQLAGKLFKDVRLVNMAASMETLAVPEIEGLDADVKAMLEARAKHLRDVGQKALDMKHDGWRDSYTDNLCQHIVGLRKAGISADLPKEMNQAVGDVYAKDENGKLWDDLRTTNTSTAAAPSAPSKPAVALVKGDTFWPTIEGALKSINFHINNGSPQSINKTKVEAALALKDQVDKLAASKGQKAAMAKLYAAHLAKIDETMKAATSGIKPKAIAQLNPYAPKPKKTKAASTPAATATAKKSDESLVTRLAAYMAAHGGDHGAVAAWKGSQAGDSWNPEAMAKKAWLAKHLNLPASDIFWRKSAKQSGDELAKLESRFSAEKVEAAFTIHHAFVQELLAHTQMRHSDRAARALRLVRTEEIGIFAIYGTKQGYVDKIPRGVCESSSLFSVTAVYGKEATIQAVPFSRVTGSYLMERHPGTGQTGFYGDGENEFTFVTSSLPFNYVGTVKDKLAFNKQHMDAGNAVAGWDVPLHHLRQ